MKNRFSLLLIICCLIGCPASLFSAEYSITDLGYETYTNSYATGSWAKSINNSNQIVGASFEMVEESQAFWQWHPHLWQPSTNGYIRIDLPVLQGGYVVWSNYPPDMRSGAAPAKINDAGQIIGYSLIANETYPSPPVQWFGRAALWTPSETFSTNYSITNLGIPGGSSPFRTSYPDGDILPYVYSDGGGINNSGQIVGFKAVGNEYAEGAGFAPGYDIVGGIGITWTTGINDAGQVIGNYWNATNGYSGFITTNDSPTYLSGLGAAGSTALGINSAGDIVGLGGTTNGYHAALWTNTSLTAYDLGTLGEDPNSRAYAINNVGQIVGESGTSWLGGRGFIYDSTNGMRDLNSLIPEDSEWVLVAAFDINDNGWIVGVGYKTTGDDAYVRRGFVLTPTP